MMGSRHGDTGRRLCEKGWKRVSTDRQSYYFWCERVHDNDPSVITRHAHAQHSARSHQYEGGEEKHTDSSLGLTSISIVSNEAVIVHPRAGKYELGIPKNNMWGLHCKVYAISRKAIICSNMYAFLRRSTVEPDTCASTWVWLHFPRTTCGVCIVRYMQLVGKRSYVPICMLFFAVAQWSQTPVLAHGSGSTFQSIDTGMIFAWQAPGTVHTDFLRWLWHSGATHMCHMGRAPLANEWRRKGHKDEMKWYLRMDPKQQFWIPGSWA